MDDWDLIREYASNGSQEAFRTLVGRYVDFVYSAAFRQVRDRHLAEDVTQGVFIVLSRKAADLARQRPGVLAGWLFKVVRFTSANAIKTEKRRRHHEAEGFQMNQTMDDRPADWEEIAPHLDEALAGLGGGDRGAVLMRFFSGKSHRDIGLAMGISEEAAKKRVSRAVDKMRQLLHRQGVTVGTIALATLIGAQGVQAAPLGLAATCGGTISAGAAGGLANGAIAMMAATKVKMVIVGVLTFVLTASAGGLAIKQALQARQSVPLEKAAPVNPAVGASVHPVAMSKTVAGTVHIGNGEPIAGAEVLLAIPDHPVDIYSNRATGAGMVKTGEDGSFAFDVPDGPCLIVVRHALGYAQATREQLDATPQITLQPWAKIEGVAKIGSKLAAGAIINLSRFQDWQNPYTRLFTHDQTTTADAQGHYSFDRVAAGDTWICRRIAGPHAYVAAIEYVEAESGKTMTVALGGRGRPVVGRVAIPANSPEKIDWQFKRTSSFAAGLFPVRLPLGGDVVEVTEAMSWEERRVLREKWDHTLSGRQSKLSYGLSFWVNPDGSFRIDDVPVGSSRLSVSIFQNDNGNNSSDCVAMLDTSINIGDLSASGGQSDEPLDVGTLMMGLQPRLRLGQPAPMFTAKKLDGSEVKLNDFAGKFVLLVPWAEMRRPTDEDFKSIKLANDRDGKDGKLIILTVAFDSDDQAARRLVKASGLTDIGVHCTAAYSHGTLPDLFAGHAIIPPDYFQGQSLITLIDPDGKVVAKNLSGENIEGAVYRANFAR
jgi:RNA polymerase sigma factor (sigma-70 family)